MHCRIMVLGVGCVLASSAAVHASVFSDDFNAGQASSTNNQAPTVNGGFDAGTSLTMPYGSRSLFTFVTANSDPGDARGRTAINNGAFTFSSDSEVTGFGFVGYSFNTPIDLSTTGAFQFTFLSNDEPGAVLLTAIDSSGNDSQYQYTVPLPVVTAANSPFTFTVPDLFAINNSDPTATDLAHVQKLQFGFGGVAGEDLAIDSLQTVSAPEPASLGIAAVGAGLLLRRRRQRGS